MKDPHRAPITKNFILSTNAEIAFTHARLTGPFPQGEPVIATDPQYAAWYAKYVLKGPFPLGEPVILADERMSVWYQKEVLDRDWEGEEQMRQTLGHMFGKKTHPRPLIWEDNEWGPYRRHS